MGLARKDNANISLLPLPHRAALANSLALCDGCHSCACASSATGSAQVHSPNGDCLPRANSRARRSRGHATLIGITRGNRAARVAPREQKRKGTQLRSFSFCERAIKKIFLSECLRDLNSRALFLSIKKCKVLFIFLEHHIFAVLFHIFIIWLTLIIYWNEQSLL